MFYNSVHAIGSKDPLLTGVYSVILNHKLCLNRYRFADRAFAVAAPRVWNSLPTDIKVHRSTTTSFKRRLKTVLFNRGFAEYM